jgi:hypothetical protein
MVSPARTLLAGLIFQKNRDFRGFWLGGFVAKALESAVQGASRAKEPASE